MQKNFHNNNKYMSEIYTLGMNSQKLAKIKNMLNLSIMYIRGQIGLVITTQWLVIILDCYL